MLYKAQFQKSFFMSCYLRHILRKAVFSFPCCYGQHSFFCMPGTVVIGSTIPVYRIFASVVVKRSTFFAEQLFLTGIVTESTIQKILFYGCYTWHFSKIPPKIATADFLRKKYFFALLPSAHCSAAHSPVVRQRTEGLESTAQFCCNFRHSYTLFLNIYKYSLKFPKTKNAYFRRGKRNVLNVTIIDTRRTIWYYTLNELRDTFREIRMLF